MRSRGWKFRIQDILDAIDRIQSYVQGRSLEQFSEDRRTLDAVERNFIIIGEAARQVPLDVQESFPTIPWREMADMRNYVVHQYWGVEINRVWDTIHENLPPIKPLLKNLIENAPE
ncbi:MAG: DUF86 domain-containing protein [Thermodesulfobacteriota bacterium]